MSDTALIDEIREVRHRIAAECGNGAPSKAWLNL